MTTRAAIYYRVSTEKQDAESQLPELEQYVKKREFTLVGRFVDDAISATKGEDERDGLADIMELARKRKIDVLVVWAYDRFARTLLDGIMYLDELQRLGVDYISLQQDIDTRTPMGRMYYQVNQIFAEYERRMISERTKLKLKALRDKGVKLGRPEVPEAIRDRVRALRAEGHSVREIARRIEWVRASGEYGRRKVVPISKSMVSKILKTCPPNGDQNVAPALDGASVAK